MADAFAKVKDQHFMALMRRRAYMLAFPGEILPQTSEIVLRIDFPNGCCEHGELRVFVGKNIPKGITGKTLVNWDAVSLLCEFFGIEEDEDA